MRFLIIACVFFPLGIFFSQTPEATQSAPAVFPQMIPWDTEKALIISANRPVYPQIAVMARVEGCVYIGITISTDGSVRNSTVLGGTVLMFESALDAAKTWKFTPPFQEASTVAPICYFLPGDKRAKLLSSYQKTAEKYANNPQKLVVLGRQLLWAGLPEQAGVQFRRALSVRAGDSDAEFGLADSLAASGELAAATAAYRDSIAANSRNVDARIHLARLLSYQGDLDGAIAQERALLQTDPKNPFYHLVIGELLLKKGDVEGSIGECQEALHYGPKTWWSAHYRLGQAFEKKGDTADALNQYKIATKGMPQNAEFRDAYTRLSKK